MEGKHDVIPLDAPMEGQSWGWPPGVGRAGGRHSGPGSVGFRGWSCPQPAPLGVGAGGWVIAQPGQHDQVERLVELAVAGAIQPHPDRLAAGGRDGGGPTQHGVGGIGAAAAGMGPGTEHDGGHHRTHASGGEQVGPPGPDKGRDGPGVLGDLGVQELDAAGQRTQAGRGGCSLNIPGGPLTEPPAGPDQARRGQATQPPTEAVGSGDHEGVELALAVGGGLNRRASGGQPHRQRRPVTGRSRLGEPVATQASRAALAASKGSDLAPWRRAARLGRSSSTTCSA